MAAVSESLRAMAREALLHAGGRGFMRFAPSGGALLITDAPRHCGEEADRRRLCGALRTAGFLCREEGGLWMLSPDDALLGRLGAAWQEGPPLVDWDGLLEPAQELAARFLKEEPLPMSRSGRQLALEMLRLLWQDERRVLTGLDGIRARAAEMLREGDRSGMREAGACLAGWCKARVQAAKQEFVL